MSEAICVMVQPDCVLIIARQYNAYISIHSLASLAGNQAACKQRLALHQELTVLPVYQSQLRC